MNGARVVLRARRNGRNRQHRASRPGVGFGLVLKKRRLNALESIAAASETCLVVENRWIGIYEPQNRRRDASCASSDAEYKVLQVNARTLIEEARRRDSGGYRPHIFIDAKRKRCAQSRHHNAIGARCANAEKSS
jgi:hypothetical protein